MSDVRFEDPVRDTVPKIDNTVAVGEDLNFQRSWWRFEKVVWVVFALVLLADVLGFFGRGYFSKAEMQTSDKTLRVKYERTERASTPSIMTLEFGPASIHDGRIQLFASRSIIEDLGNQRISPQPSNSELTNGGVTYTFPASSNPVYVQFALEPSFPGLHTISLQVPGSEKLSARIFVVP